MLYIAKERVYRVLRLRMDSPRTETASRWFIMRYLLTAVHGKQGACVRPYTYTRTFYSLCIACAQTMTIFRARSILDRNSFLSLGKWMCLYARLLCEVFSWNLVEAAVRKRLKGEMDLLGLFRNWVSVIDLTWIEDVWEIELAFLLVFFFGFLFFERIKEYFRAWKIIIEIMKKFHDNMDDYLTCLK